MLSSRLRNNLWDSLFIHTLSKDKIKERSAFKRRRRFLLEAFGITKIFQHWAWAELLCMFQLDQMPPGVIFVPGLQTEYIWYCQWTGNEHLLLPFLFFFFSFLNGLLKEIWWSNKVSNFLINPKKTCNFLKVTELVGCRDGAC